MNADADSPTRIQRCEYILLAHQDALARQSIRSILKKAGFTRVITLDTARAVVSKLRLGTCNLLITSFSLADRDAWTLTRIIRSGRFCRESLPILVLFLFITDSVDELKSS